MTWATPGTPPSNCNKVQQRPLKRWNFYVDWQQQIDFEYFKIEKTTIFNKMYEQECF
jgi:hypothetical protein